MTEYTIQQLDSTFRHILGQKVFRALWEASTSRPRIHELCILKAFELNMPRDEEDAPHMQILRSAWLDLRKGQYNPKGGWTNADQTA